MSSSHTQNWWFSLHFHDDSREVLLLIKEILHRHASSILRSIFTSTPGSLDHLKVNVYWRTLHSTSSNCFSFFFRYIRPGRVCSKQGLRKRHPVKSGGTCHVPHIPSGSTRQQGCHHFTLCRSFFLPNRANRTRAPPPSWFARV